MRIDALLSGMHNLGQGIKLSADILEKLNIGDVLRAQVVDISATELVLKLFDGSMVKASALCLIDTKKGDVLDFKIHDKKDNQLVLETIKTNKNTNIDSNIDLKNKLTSIKIAPTEINLEIAKELVENGITVKNETIKSIANMLQKFGSLTASKAVYMMSTGMQLEEKNISSLVNFVDNKFKLDQKLDDLFETIKVASADIEISKIKDTSIANYTLKENALKSQNDKNLYTKEAKIVSGSQLNQVIDVKDHKITLTDLMDIVEDKYLKKSNITGNENITRMFEDINFNQKIEEYFSKLSKGSTHGITVGDISKFIESEIDLFKKDTMIISRAGNQPEEFFKDLLDVLNKDEMENNQKVLTKNILSESNIKQSLDGLFIKLDTLKEDNNLNLKDIYKGIYNKLEGLKDLVNASSINTKDDVISKIDNIESSLKFINELNNHTTYLQIPLNIWGKNTTGELYVLKKGSKKKRIDPENFTMLLSLDTENLGVVDSLVEINKKNVVVSMRFEDKDIIDFVKKNYKVLHESLLEKGYKLSDFRCKHRDTDISIENVNKVAKAIEDEKRISIDLKL